jgi:hypothetical protein
MKMEKKQCQKGLFSPIDGKQKRNTASEKGCLQRTEEE